MPNPKLIVGSIPKDFIKALGNTATFCLLFCTVFLFCFVLLFVVVYVMNLNTNRSAAFPIRQNLITGFGEKKDLHVV